MVSRLTLRIISSVIAGKGMACLFSRDLSYPMRHIQSMLHATATIPRTVLRYSGRPLSCASLLIVFFVYDARCGSNWCRAQYGRLIARVACGDCDEYSILHAVSNDYC
jgi:hypothetical protein